jgi:two-component system, LytTR family, response regulator
MESTIKCIIVDDEPLAQDLLEKFVKRLSYLNLLGTFDNALEALEAVERLKPDLILLDINMPEMSGLELIRSFHKDRPNIILTTAYSEYAIDGFEYGVIDYLLKPIPFDRFIKALNKVKEKMSISYNGSTDGANFFSVNEPFLNLEREVQSLSVEKDQSSNESQDYSKVTGNYLWVKSDRKVIKLDIEEMVYVEGMKDYVKIFMRNSMTVSHIPMNKMEKLLENRMKYLRINRSFIINTKFMTALEGNMVVLENQKKLTIGLTYRDGIKKAIKMYLS